MQFVVKNRDFWVVKEEDVGVLRRVRNYTRCLSHYVVNQRKEGRDGGRDEGNEQENGVKNGGFL